VVAIIAILAAMLLPVLAKAKAQAWRIQCVNNEHQMMVAWTLYSGDNRELLALNGGENPTPPPGPYLWVYGGNHGDPQTLTNLQYLVGSVGATSALFSAYIRSVPVYKCAADRSLWPLGSKNVFELRSYSLNSYVGTIAGNAQTPITLSTAYKVYLKAATLAADMPASRFTFIDVNPASICTPGFGVDMSADTFIHYPSSFHNGGGVLAYADGHVQAHKWTDSRTRKALPGGAQYIPHYDPSANNADLKWIRERTTSLK
jgi:prepilin-type processing-associated H-X9-DG protein